MEFVNKERFSNFVSKKAKYDAYDLVGFMKLEEECMKELIESARNGNSFYELRGHETRSGHAESISFEYTYDYNEELDEVLNEKITF